MDLIQALLLGLLQGITEWLPISSQGQVVAVAVKAFGMSVEEALKYSVFLHAGTLVSALVYLRKEVLEISLFKDKKLLKFFAIALAATAVTAIPSIYLLKTLANSSTIIILLLAAALLVTGGIQLAGKKKKKKATETNKNALWLGMGQGFAAIPGVSRSGITTSTLLFEGFEPEKAFKLSFLLSIPTVLTAEILLGLFEPIALDLNALTAVIVAAVVGLASIKLLIELAKKIRFGWFCIGFGVFYLAIAFI